MKFEQIQKLKEKFAKEYGPAFESAGNHLSTGITVKNGSYQIAVRLENELLKSSLPADYHGVKLDVRITGTIKAL